MINLKKPNNRKRNRIKAAIIGGAGCVVEQARSGRILGFKDKWDYIHYQVRMDTAKHILPSYYAKQFYEKIDQRRQ